MFLALALVLVPLCAAWSATWLLPNRDAPAPHADRRRRRRSAGSLERKIEAHPEYGLELVGFVDDERGPRACSAAPSDLAALVDTLEIDWVILAFSERPARARRSSSCARCAARTCTSRSSRSFFELFASNADDRGARGHAGREPAADAPLAHACARSSAAFDVVASAAGLLALSPLLAGRRRSRSSSTRRARCFFRQARHGRGGRDLPDRQVPHDGRRRRGTALRAGAPQRDGGRRAAVQDRTTTRASRASGAFLRKRSIDELPQLWNVLRGEMSLVGPRPFVVHESEQITGWAGRRLDTTPGITGLWQVLGRNDIPFEEMVKLDYVYVTNWSLWWDIKILLQTIPVVLAGGGRTDARRSWSRPSTRRPTSRACSRDLEGRPGAVAGRPRASSWTTARRTAPSRSPRAHDRGRCRSRCSSQVTQPGPGPRVRPRASAARWSSPAPDDADRHDGVRHHERPRRARGHDRRAPARAPTSCSPPTTTAASWSTSRATGASSRAPRRRRSAAARGLDAQHGLLVLPRLPRRGAAGRLRRATATA